ncbi:uncharacterized protein K452DRAFT_226758 [Aplosporella prunicola CBS 121167]|uniref:Ras guanine-nucleotide exchange protein n=1 Tax=Aplosporella prunicola CBS 121167 TaxID=1176127 RepID=A0A6A6BID1_9PEZI|nr:uncharacterized protein K452DRAFT_226758 [Aplosporella prunicola CBS 121167]KAF2142597.1 hypothetical protein K452DRAFT_226758 [Aplosporella prunicola CBS 121167]
MTNLTERGPMDRTSACVAPLSIKKKPSASWDHDSRQNTQSSPKNKRAPSAKSCSQTCQSPQATPDSVHAEPESFPNFLRAFYHFHPSAAIAAADESSVTIPINQGDVILVHSIHPNGWADGTLLGSGARGWLPTNYCEPYDYASMRNLLSALTHVWDLVRSGENGNPTVFTKQDYVRAMIAGVRILLENCDCLTRDSQTVQAHISVRRMRKGLLGDLSALVKTAKHLQQAAHDDLSSVQLYELLDELVLKAFKVVTRAVRFLDVWTQETGAEQPLENTDRPSTPSHDTIKSNDGHSNVAEERAAGVSQNATVVLQPSASTTSDERSELTSSTPPGHTFDIYSASTPSLSSSAPAQPPHNKRTSVSHRVSYTNQAAGPRRHNLASERLSAAQDSFLGFIGSFIGLHLQSRSSSELLTTTQQSVFACRQLLVVVQEVWERDSQRSEPLALARDTMHEKLFELVQATKGMFVSSETSNSDDVIVPTQGKEIVEAATSCVRAAGDCMSKARVVIEKIGDFEFEHTGPGLSDSIFDSLDFAPISDTTHERSTSQHDISKPLPAPPEPVKLPLPPPPQDKPLPEPPASASVSSPTANSAAATELLSPTASSFRSSKDSLPSLAKIPIPNPPSNQNVATEESPSTYSNYRYGGNSGNDNINGSDSTSTYPNSLRGDGASIISHTSTRATTPEDSPNSKADSVLVKSFPSISELQSELHSTTSEDCYKVEAQVLERTYVHELVFKDGQIAGGSLPALVEQLTTHEATPEPTFVNTFYLTFRLFTTPREFAEALIDRFNYVEDSPDVACPVRLRVHNIFKGWLETHWQPEDDSDALGVILAFATGKLRTVLPNAGKRLAELIAKVSGIQASAPTNRLLSSLGKTNTSATVYSAADPNVPNPIVSKSQLNALRATRAGATVCSILDFDPLELARQFTLIESRIFCSIQPEELLASEWTKKNGRAVNVRAMSKLSTDLTNLVADTILQLEEPKKRAVIIKQWVKVAAKCLELNNYDSLMAIICALNSSMVLRLKRTWEALSSKTHSRLSELRAIVEVERNYAVLRKRLENHVAPCIPFVGMYLTDLTFVDVGNQTTRQLPGASGNGRDGLREVINFDKHMRTAKIIGQLQRFQVPYALAPVLEMQHWMQVQIARVRSSDQSTVQNYYRRSLLLEPREMHQHHSGKGSPSVDSGAFTHSTTRDGGKERFEFLNAMFSAAMQRERGERNGSQGSIL